MGTKVSAPKPTAEENALRSEQTALLQAQRDILLQQQKQQNALLPLFAQQMGFDLQFDSQGNVIGGTQSENAKHMKDLQDQVLEKSLNQMLNPESDPLYAQQMQLYKTQLQRMQDDAQLDPQRMDIEKQLLTRSQKALAGELDLDPALERDITGQRQALQERLQSQFGPGYDTSSAGIEAMNRFEESASVLRSQARHGELTLSEQLSLARQGADQAQGAAGIGAASAPLPGVNPLQSGGFAFGLNQGGNAGLGQFGQILGAPMSIAGGLGQTAQGYQLPIGQLQNNRQMQMDASIANARSSMGGLGAIGGIFGSLLGAM